MDQAKQRIIERKRRAARIRKKISGTAECPRLSVRRSLNHIYAQIIDDDNRSSLVQVGSNSPEVKQKLSDSEANKKSDISKIVGELVAEKAKEKGISKVVFDRRGYAYQGRIRALAAAVRKSGLEF
ncbi:MAG: 50S ribosomal protein L18 [Chitinivibrionales bacterium]|nr:50S ribosomal protein L18 [Chitinivibrionales bacterium]